MWWSRFFRRKAQSPEKDLQALVEACKKTLGETLESFIVYGSYASGEYQSSHSDVNVFLVLKSLSVDSLKSLSGPLKPWIHKGHTLPTISSTQELPRLAKTHPIEFLDLKDHHKVLAGTDTLTTLNVDTSGLRSQCEHDLARIALKLRQQTAAGADNDHIRQLLIKSVPSVLTILRAALRLRQESSGLSKIDAAERLAPLAGVDPLLLRQLHEFRFARKSDDLQGLLSSYFEVIEKVRQSLAVS